LPGEALPRTAARLALPAARTGSRENLRPDYSNIDSV